MGGLELRESNLARGLAVIEKDSHLDAFKLWPPRFSHLNLDTALAPNISMHTPYDSLHPASGDLVVSGETLSFPSLTRIARLKDSSRPEFRDHVDRMRASHHTRLDSIWN